MSAKLHVAIAALCLAVSFAATARPTADTTAQAAARGSVAEKISFATTLGTGFATDGRTRPFAWRVMAHYNPVGRWSAGVGTGVSVYERTLVPIFVDVRYRIGRERLFTPFVEAVGGYSFALSAGARGGPMVNPSVGVRRRVGDGIGLTLSAGWEMQRFGRLLSRTDRYFHKEFAERLTRGALCVSFGVAF